MATARTASARLKATIVQAPAQDDAQSAFSNVFDALGIPTGKRVLVSFVISMLAGAVTAYALQQIVTALAIGTALLTGSAFFTFIVMFLGYALLVLSTVVIAGKVQTFILNGDIDRMYEGAKHRVTGWLGSAKSKAANFTARVSA